MTEPVAADDPAAEVKGKGVGGDGYPSTTNTTTNGNGSAQKLLDVESAPPAGATSEVANTATTKGSSSHMSSSEDVGSLLVEQPLEHRLADITTTPTSGQQKLGARAVSDTTATTATAVTATQPVNDANGVAVPNTTTTTTTTTINGGTHISSSNSNRKIVMVDMVPESAADAAAAAVMAMTGDASNMSLNPDSGHASLRTPNNNNNHNHNHQEPSAYLTSTVHTKGGTDSRRGSSLELRKLPVNVLLRPESKLFDEELSIDDIDNKFGDHSSRRSLMQRSCLNSKFTLRAQMMLSFGVISACTMILVVLVCIAMSVLSGEVVKEKTRTTFDQIASDLEARATRYIAEDLTPRLLMEDVVHILYEITLDRFYGYPVANDSKVPYWDTLTDSNKYPIRGRPLPLDWQIDINVDSENYPEHVQDRWYLYGGREFSTANAAYYMQGMCDPEETDPNSYTYLEGCTPEHNNITTGGVYAPTPSNADIHRKASDLSPILKAIFEYHMDVKHVGSFFVNGGAGATVNYPGIFLDGTSNYTSVGCDYLSGPHPLDPSRPILMPEEVELCRKSVVPVTDQQEEDDDEGGRVEGAIIPTRLYSPLDRGWCRDQILNPGKVQVLGPYLDAWSEGVWLMAAGQALYEPNNNELIGCTLLEVDIMTSTSTLESSKVSNNSHVSVVRWSEEGTVLVSTAWDLSKATETASIWNLNIGIPSQSVYEQYYNLVNFKGYDETTWNASVVDQMYHDFDAAVDGVYRVKAYPIPPIPDAYDPNYQPEFLVFVSVSVADIFVFADRVEDQVDDRVGTLSFLSLAVGAAGLALVIAVLFAVSNYITRPLTEMNKTAIRIIDNFGEDSKIVVEDSTKDAKELVRTELTQIVKEFQRMVRKFSGGAMARSAKMNLTEVDNQFQMIDEFNELYTSRSNDKSFKYHIERSPDDNIQNLCADSSVGGSGSGGGQRGPIGVPVADVKRLNYGHNLQAMSSSTTVRSSNLNLLREDRENAYSSPLFRWIVALIVLPLLLSTITISAAVITTVSLELPDMINDAERGMIALQVSGLSAFAHLRAGFVSKSSEYSIRDLYLQTRYASWLIFGGVKANAFPEMVTATQPCKQFERADMQECPFIQENHVCDCTWPNTADRPCENYSDYGIDSRYLQKPHFIGSSQDVDENGDRYKSTYPKVATSSNATAWWSNQHEVPGAPSSNASVFEPEFIQGYGTTYQRLRSAASSPLYIPMRRYKGREDNVLTTFVAFEADGMYLAHTACNNLFHSGNGHWVSTEDNGGARLRPDICPLGLHGYDARCRGWYDSGRNSYLYEDAQLHVTPAYLFSGGGNFSGQSCTAPLFDPETKEHVGQVLVDFRSTRIFKSLDKEHTPLAKGGFPLLLTMQSDVYGADVVLGPGLLITDPAKDVRDVVSARNETCDENICGFEKIVKGMKAGKRGGGMFVLEEKDGTPVTYHVAYSPVVVKSFRQVDSSDFSRGVEHVPFQLYSLALAEPEASMLDSFQRAEDDIEGVVYIGLAVLCTVIVAASGMVVWLSHRITMSMIEPMYYLLELIRHINRLDVGQDPPEENLHGGYGSREVLNVRMTMEKLYKIIQCANSAYFAGETEVAYEVFTDALRLFTKLDNRKAMGVANNNLGNTMLTFYRTMQATGNETVSGLNKRQIIGKGMAYFHQAIQLGEKAYDAFYEAEGWSPNCLHFMQHLSNRYFNRAMFLLTVKDDHEKPKEIEELGMRDLQIARDMDVEIVDEGTQVGWNVRKAEAHLEVLLCRIRGHVTLLEMGYADDWDVDEMLDAAFKILKAELANESTDLFNEIGPAGRMQQIEFLLMRYSVVNADLETAAKIAIRMLVEDEFILPEAQTVAVEVMIDYAELMYFAPDVVRKLKEYKDWLQDAVDELETQKSSKDALETTRSSFVSDMATSRRILGLDKSGMSTAASLRESTRGDVTMEAF